MQARTSRRASGACGRVDSSSYGGDAGANLARGSAFAAQLAARRPAELSESELVALGYLERARIGLGSPFRLVEFALNDPLLPAEIRPRVAYAIFALVAQSRVYEVEPAVLDLSLIHI